MIRWSRSWPRQHEGLPVDVLPASNEEYFPPPPSKEQMAIMSRPDARPDLPRIKCPTLVLVGEADQLTPPALSEEMAAAIPGSRLVVVPGSGHLSTLERPEAVTQALVEWMER